MRTWIIGSGTDCDLVVARATVSGRHCRLTETADGYLLEDLGSSNGTYVNGERIASATRVCANDTITLGLTVSLPLPEVAASPGATVVRIGRDADNEIVLDDPRVSGHHARLIVAGSKTLIEDLGSSNGTFVNSPDQRATESIPIAEPDVVYFGSLAVPAARLLSARAEPAKAVPLPTPEPEPLVEPVSVSPAPAPEADDRGTLLLIAQAPILALLILLVFGRQAAAASGTSVAQGIASTTFALALAAVWLGGSLAAWAASARRMSNRREGSLEARLLASPVARLVVLGVLCMAECAVLLAIVYWGSGLRGSWLAMFGVLLLDSAVGLSFGLAVFALSRTPATAYVVLMLSFLPMIALGGWIWPLTVLSPAVRPVAAAMPSRWAFEGLLLLESHRRPPPGEPAGPERHRDSDLAEGFFPVDSERMGPKADAMALGFMLIGLAAAAAFISRSSKPSP
jgi:pSer/pThr/pTyr-binding forkhead associated (FHA) protein